MTSTRLWCPAVLVKTRVWMGCSFSRAHKTWSRSLLWEGFSVLIVWKLKLPTLLTEEDVFYSFHSGTHIKFHMLIKILLTWDMLEKTIWLSIDRSEVCVEFFSPFITTPLTCLVYLCHAGEARLIWAACAPSKQKRIFLLLVHPKHCLGDYHYSPFIHTFSSLWYGHSTVNFTVVQRSSVGALPVIVQEK